MQKIHRISHRFFAPGTVVRADIDRFSAPTSDEPLWKFQNLFVALLEYALTPVLERRIEEVHARIKRIGYFAFHGGLPYLRPHPE